MDFKAPDDWVAMVDDDAPRTPAWLSRYELHGVPLGSDSATALQERLRESLPHARLVSVEFIQHRNLWRRYERCRADVAFYNGGDAYEESFFHGTGAKPPISVLEHQCDLDPRFSKGGFYGNGIYLAERAAYPVGGRYAHRVAGHGGTRFQLLVVQVAVGTSQEMGLRVDAMEDGAQLDVVFAAHVRSAAVRRCEAAFERARAAGVVNLDVYTSDWASSHVPVWKSTDVKSP